MENIDISFPEKTPFYDPPFESPIEEEFARCMDKYLDNSVEFRKQVEVNTICGTFRLDFVLVSKDLKIAFECDGKDYHDTERDEWRDSMIIGDRTVDVIYRLSGQSINYNTNDCIFVIADFHPDIFSARGLRNIKKLASVDVLSERYQRNDEITRIYYEDEETGEFCHYSTTVKRCFREPYECQYHYWERYYKYAKDLGGGKLDDVIQRYSNEHGISRIVL